MDDEDLSDRESDFTDVVETLSSLFGNVMNKDVIVTIVESYSGDLNLAADAIMSITSDVPNESALSTDEPVVAVESTPPLQEETHNNEQLPAIPTQSLLSYAGVSTGAIPKKKPNSPKCLPNAGVWTDQLSQIVTYHNEGSRVLILMRGVPGSGKSYLAKQIVEMTIGHTSSDYKNHIYSTDDYFYVNGVYQYDKSRLSEAHEWNQNRVRDLLERGVSPLIVDNTNIVIWEMEPYWRHGVNNGYIIEAVEPITPWARKAHQLLKKNSHNVPIATIKRMLQNYECTLSRAEMRSRYGLSYKAHMVPPVLRTIPAVSNLHTDLRSEVVPRCSDTQTSFIQTNTRNEQNFTITVDSTQTNQSHELAPGISENLMTAKESLKETKEIEKQKRYTAIQNTIDEMEKVEQEWENGETWDAVSQNKVNSSNDHSTCLDPKPPRGINTSDSIRSDKSTPSDNMMEGVQKCEDWTQISMFMPPWKDESSSQKNDDLQVPIVTESSSTCMEIGDTDVSNPKHLKIITSVPRDINISYVCLNRAKIPVNRMLDNSTMTNEALLRRVYRCKNEEQHFVALTKLFKNYSKDALRDVFENCLGDVNWAVDIVIASINNNELGTVDIEALSEENDNLSEQCNCLAAYSVVPDTEPVSSTLASPKTVKIVDNISQMLKEPGPLPQRKLKSAQSATSLQLKREIENNLDFSDDNYSKHCLKIKNMRRGVSCPDSPLYVSENGQAATDDEVLPSTSTGLAVCPPTAADDSADQDSNTTSTDESPPYMNINIGHEFLSQLDELYGRKNIAYPEVIVPIISVPVSLLNKINAFWMESLMHQLDMHDQQNTKMVEQDAEFARQLALKEDELAQLGKEPEVPDFKEIMDMDFALSLYHKQVEEWRNKEPTDLAAKLTRDKLHGLFPEMAPDILSQILMAHDNNFETTVEVLLTSIGRSDILQEKNGVNKFVMAKEMARQEKLLEEEKKALSAMNWPLLPKSDNIDNMSVVEGYRSEANAHLLRRNQAFGKAQEYIRRGMTQVASYYSGFAEYHKRRFEHANCMAAAALVQFQSRNSRDNLTLDMHYLRVGEAMVTLDLFLDTHIQKLKENKVLRQQTLYIITGRGLHSIGGPKIKPATRARLQERQLRYDKGNAGLLLVKIRGEDKLSYEL